jgi:DNA polymerase-3 subunit delta'
VDTLNKESANAMLKTLEEPPANTVIMLLTERLHSVLPTLVSRCQIMRLGYIPDEVLGEALSREHGLDRNDPRLRQALAEAGGSYATATAALAQPQDLYLDKAVALWRLCFANDWLAIGAALDRLVEDDLGFGRDYFGAERILAGLIQITRLCFLRKVDAGGKYISSAAIPADLPLPSLEPSAAGALMEACQQAIGAVRGYGNIQMILVTLLFSITELLHGKEQQSG